LKRYGYTVQSGAATNAPSANTATKGSNEVGNE